MAHARHLVFAALVSGCTTGSSTLAHTSLESAQDTLPEPDPDPDPDPGGALDAPVPVPAPPCPAATMRACFGDPQLVAGTGQLGAKGQDGWRPEYEAGPARAAELSRPHFAMADDAGNIYIADKDAHAVRRVSPEGTITTISADFASPNGLWVLGDGTVYVLDLGHAAIQRVDPDGAVSVLFRVPGALSIGRGLWVAADESLAYVASGTRVLAWTPAGGTTVLAEGFRSLANLVVDPEGQLVVTDRGAGQVYRLDAQGRRTVLAGSGGKGVPLVDGAPAQKVALPGVRAIWFSPEGGYFLGTHESDRVLYVDPVGLIHPFLGDGEVSEVRGLSLEPDGDLLIVDDDRGFVRVLHREPPP